MYYSAVLQVWDSLYEEAELLPGMAEEDARLLQPAGIAAKAAKLKEEVHRTNHYRRYCCTGLYIQGPTAAQLLAPAFQASKLPAPTKRQLKKSFAELQTAVDSALANFL